MDHNKLEELKRLILAHIERAVQDGNEQANCGGEWLVYVKGEKLAGRYRLDNEEFSVSATDVALEILAEDASGDTQVRFRIKIELEQVPDGQ